MVNYQPGALEAVGFKNGKKVIIEKVKTTGEAASLKFEMYKSNINEEGIGTAVINITATDKNGLIIPTADNEINFSLSGPAKIIGVGNGNPFSMEKDRFIETISTVEVEIKKEKAVETGENNMAAIAIDFDDKLWNDAFIEERNEQFGKKVKSMIYRGEFFMPEYDSNATITFFSTYIGVQQSLFINGVLLADHLVKEKDIIVNKKMLHTGKNSIAIMATPLLKKNQWDTVNTNPGLIQLFTPATGWKRKLFNGLAQVIVQTENIKGEVKLTATAEGLPPSTITIQ